MRLMTITMEVSDEEATNLLTRFAERGAAGIDGVEVAAADNSAELAPAPDAAEIKEAVTGEPALDVNGVPWNATHHASTKGVNKDGSWKARRGMTDAEKQAAAIYEQSFAGQPAPAVSTAPDVPVTPTAPTPPAPPVPALTVPVAPVAPQPVSFEELTAGFGEVIGRVGQDVLMANLGKIYEDAGVDSQGVSLQSNETQRAQVLAAIKAL